MLPVHSEPEFPTTIRTVIVFTPRFLTATCLVAAWSLLVAGCATPRRTVTPAVSDHVETVAFTSMADRVDIVDQATSAIISANFAITLANDRIGLVQSDFIPLSRVQSALADSLPPHPDFSNILVRVAVNAERGNETKYVQVKGTFQRISGLPRTTDDLVGLYWLEQLTARMADGVDATFVHQVSDSTYARLLGESAPTEEKKSPGISGALKVAGILVAVLFVVQLASGAFGPVSTPAPSQ